MANPIRHCCSALPCPFRALLMNSILTQGGARIRSLALGWFPVPRWGKTLLQIFQIFASRGRAIPHEAFQQQDGQQHAADPVPEFVWLQLDVPQACRLSDRRSVFLDELYGEPVLELLSSATIRVGLARTGVDDLGKPLELIDAGKKCLRGHSGRGPSFRSQRSAGLISAALTSDF